MEKINYPIYEMENKIHVSNHQPVYIYIWWRIKVPGGFHGGYISGWWVKMVTKNGNFWDLSWDLLGYTIIWLVWFNMVQNPIDYHT